MTTKPEPIQIEVKVLVRTVVAGKWVFLTAVPKKK
jgi:hypothetical protein